MSPPDKRSVGPGAQPMRVDSVKDMSWVDTSKAPLIGRIFFVTARADLYDNDMAELNKIFLAYHAKLVRYSDLGKRLDFEINGYADRRHTKEYNYQLSENRANAVANYLATQLSAYSAYRATVRGRGIDYNSLSEPANSTALARFRRVDIIAESPDTPQPKQEKPGELLSQDWKARLVKGVSAGAGPVAIDVFQIEIVDLTNNIAMLYKYTGLGVGWSIKGLPGFNADKSNWVKFRTTLKINVMDFQGAAVHASGQAQGQVPPGGISAGVSSDNVKLYGPERHRGAAPVSLEWIGLSDWNSKAAGVGVMISYGGIEPDPPTQKPYPAPGD